MHTYDQCLSITTINTIDVINNFDNCCKIFITDCKPAVSILIDDGMYLHAGIYQYDSSRNIYNLINYIIIEFSSYLIRIQIIIKTTKYP